MEERAGEEGGKNATEVLETGSAFPQESSDLIETRRDRSSSRHSAAADEETDMFTCDNHNSTCFFEKGTGLDRPEPPPPSRTRGQDIFHEFLTFDGTTEVGWVGLSLLIARGVSVTTDCLRTYLGKKELLVGSRKSRSGRFSALGSNVFPHLAI